MSLSERILRIEQNMIRLTAELDRSRAVDMIQAGRAPVRIGVIEGPVSSNDNTFLVRFVEGQFTETKGQQSPTWTDRQTAARVVAYNLAGSHIAANTRLPVYRYSNRWYVHHTASQSPSDHPVAIVRVDESPGIASCDAVPKPSDSVWEGYKIAPAIGAEMNEGDGSDPYGDEIPVFITDVGHCSPIASLKKNERYVGYKIGAFSKAGEARDLYAIRHFEQAEETTRIVSVIGPTSVGDNDFAAERDSFCLYEGIVYDIDNTKTYNNVCDHSIVKPINTNVWLCDLADPTTRTKWIEKGSKFVGKKLSAAFSVQGDVRELWAISTARSIVPAARYQFEDLAVPPFENTVLSNPGSVYEEYPFKWNSLTNRIDVDQNVKAMVHLEVRTPCEASVLQANAQLWPESGISVAECSFAVCTGSSGDIAQGSNARLAFLGKTSHRVTAYHEGASSKLMRVFVNIHVLNDY